MAEIRVLEPQHIPVVAGLLRAHLPDWPGDERFLADTLLDHPWVDDELASLVALDGDGEVIGFIGSQARRLRFHDRTVRGVCCSHLVVAPRARGTAAGALLLGRLLSGGQDLTWSDSANESVVRIWRRFGGHQDYVRACDWMLVLRPVRWLGGVSAAAVRRNLGRSQAPVGAIPFQAAGARLLSRAFPPPEPRGTGREATTAEIIEAMPAFARGIDLQVEHDAAYLDYVLRLIGASLGAPVCRIVSVGERPIGWYVYVPETRGVTRVLHVAAAEGGSDAVLGDLVEDARSRGLSVIAGRVEPHLAEPLRRRYAVLGFARHPLTKARDPALLAVLSTGASLLTQLDSEWFVT